MINCSIMIKLQSRVIKPIARQEYYTTTHANTLNNIIPTTHRSPSVAIRSRYGSLLEQAHQFAHGVSHRNLSFALNQNV